MPRVKGSKNKKSQLTVDQKIEALNNEIENLNVMLATKKAELKDLQKEKDAENQKKILDAIMKSGKSLDEIMELLS